jgi:hypothetical protein
MWALKTACGISSTKQRLPAMTSADQAVAGEQRHDAEDVARRELGDHRACAGVVGGRDFGVAADHDADETAFVAGLEDGFVALVGGQAGGLMTISSTLSAGKCSNRGTCSRKKRFRSISLMLVLA